jgi:thiamine biosynthesis lipoprotein
MTASTATQRRPAPLSREFRVMGCESHVVVHGGEDWMLDTAEARLRELEGLWSRFLGTSDLTRANVQAGQPVVVHDDTLAVVARSLEAWRQTAGRFDITTLPALVQHGYTHSAVDASVAAPLVPGRRVGMSAWVQVDYQDRTITVPATSAIDLGGIGKGFAADLVAEELVEAGALGAVVNVGGDVRVIGRPHDATSWFVGIEDPRQPPEHLAFLHLEDGGIATSGITVRHWTAADGSAAHHLIDPVTGRPVVDASLSATVLAADTATAEAFATAAMMLPAAEALDMLEAVRLAGLIVDHRGVVHRTTTLQDFEQ